MSELLNLSYYEQKVKKNERLSKIEIKKLEQLITQHIHKLINSKWDLI